MPYIQYDFERRMTDKTLAMIEKINAIVEELSAQGYTLTLRQLYYQLVARDVIPNTPQSYKRLGELVKDGRRCGLIDWNAIEDRTRNLQRLATWDDPADILNSVAWSYRLSRWDDQPYYIECWVEKEALAQVIEKACNPFHIPFFCCRGYTSDSEMWRAAGRLIKRMNDGKRGLILHLGDHDPSGVDMTRDIQDRLTLFNAGDVEVRRIALNMEQVKEYDPPPNPAKITDSRAKGYIEEFGRSSWELDALQPKVIDELIRSEVEPLIDRQAWSIVESQEDRDKESLHTLSDGWQEIDEFNVGQIMDFVQNFGSEGMQFLRDYYSDLEFFVDKNQAAFDTMVEHLGRILPRINNIERILETIDEDE